ncbi:MAG TPA: response regulator [Longimicrobium sp.]|uniref:response regulator n=1 Tax=Longimicrobium sp. TaxID=2029185 RepID=UPI002ED9F9C0
MSDGTRDILLVEDSDPIRTAFTILLEDAGYHVRGAGTGGEALRLATERLPDLVILDMGLPDMTGIQVVQRLKADPVTASAPVVALTGRDEDRDRRACFAAGCAAYWVKPVDTHRLVEAIPGFMAGEPQGIGNRE